jgi:hypothetical protein
MTGADRHSLAAMSGTAGSYLVECYWPDVTEPKLAAVLRRVEAASSRVRAAGADVACRGALLMPDDEVVFCLFDGDEGDIRTVSAQACLPFERIIASRWVQPTHRLNRSSPSEMP